ncbi:MAG TPA: zf-HC2 domain-containing protein, partial [Planctomycetota bacterium]|nr:zf-HC2 domain-containing protein [Planctomycetota bacterium]
MKGSDMSDACANLELYHHRGLDGPERRAFEAHLERCESCSLELDEMREVDDLLREGLSRGVEEAVRHSMTGRIRRRLDAPPPRRVWAAVAGVATAAAVAAGVFL